MLLILIIAFVIFLFVGMPLAFVMGVSSVLSLLSNPDIPGLVMAQKIFTTSDSFTLMAIPFFMLAGHLMDQANITELLAQFANTLVGHIRGGLAHTVVLVGMLMAGISGSANADASAIGSLMVPTLKKAGYNEGFTVAVVSAAAALGPIIPPSIMMIIYASITNISIAELFLAGFAPGILCGIGFMVWSYIYAKKHGYQPSGHTPGLKTIGTSFKGAIWALIMPVLILGGILSGAFTATESGAIAVVYGLAYGGISKRLNWQKIEKAFFRSVVSTVAPMIIIVMASLMSYLLIRENASGVLIGFLTQISTDPHVLLVEIVILCLFLGMFIDPTAIMLMIVPILAPLITQIGYVPLHFAIIVVVALVMGGLTPPVALVLYIVASVDNTPLEKVVGPIWPFVLIVTAVILLMIFYPPFALFIPSIIM
jgi:tripartite ATP-independent transporter DctM subunit